MNPPSLFGSYHSLFNSVYDTVKSGHFMDIEFLKLQSHGGWII